MPVGRLRATESRELARPVSRAGNGRWRRWRIDRGRRKAHVGDRHHMGSWPRRGGLGQRAKGAGRGGEQDQVPPSRTLWPELIGKQLRSRLAGTAGRKLDAGSHRNEGCGAPPSVGWQRRKSRSVEPIPATAEMGSLSAICPRRPHPLRGDFGGLSPLPCADRLAPPASRRGQAPRRRGRGRSRCGRPPPPADRWRNRPC